MHQARSQRLLFDLFESSGIGLVGLDADNRIVHANPNVGVYLDLDPSGLVGQDIRTLESSLRSTEFWRAFPGTFYCLAPGPHTLLLVVARTLHPEDGNPLVQAIILRPYSLEREFGRMRVCLNNFLAREIASHINSIEIASEFITEPELRENRQTREAFIATFGQDLTDLKRLFVQILETGEPLALASRISRARLDWKGLAEDLASKIRGLASERSVSLAAALPSRLPSPIGDYHWLYLGLFGVLSHALRIAPPLSEVTLTASHRAGAIVTEISFSCDQIEEAAFWPPPSLFELEETAPRIGRMALSDLAVTRGIFLLHGGELRWEIAKDRVLFTVSLPT